MGKSLVIVESPAKAKTISKILGKEYVVEASIGHIRDLPKSAKEIPAKVKKQKWSRLGINIESDFEPLYVVSEGKKAHVSHLKKLLKSADELYLATDEDREGESIAWHLMEVLKPKVPVKRLVFHEITPKAIHHALSNVREIKTDLVQAQEVRRVVDRLYGYQVSPLLWNKLKNRNLSAGRVQSAALRLTVERERERLVFISADWWSLEAQLQASGTSFKSRLAEWDGQAIANGSAFNDKGVLTRASSLVLTEKRVKEIEAAIKEGTATVISKKTRGFTEKPKAPFITSTLQQEAIRKLRWTAKRTMQVAQRLYENGWITYMRTDSTNLSGQALEAARGLILSNYGSQYLPSNPISYRNSKDAQEAHEAIRPAGESFKTLRTAESQLTWDEFKLYELIWKRTVASQMLPAKGERLTAKFSVDKATLVATGKTYTFQGFRLAYVEGSDDERAALSEREIVLPNFAEKDQLPVKDAIGTGHSTKPPARFTEASLVQELEKKGIGRPSTYASIIENILNRKYVFKKGSALTPSFRGMIVIRALEKHLSSLVDYDFTSRMESSLDDIATGKLERLQCLKNFYFGDRGLESLIDHAEKSWGVENEGYPVLQDSAEEELFVSFNRYGEFLLKGETRIYLNEDIAPDELSTTKVQELLSKQNDKPEPLHLLDCPTTERPVYLQYGRFGWYIQVGNDEKKKNNRNVSLLPEDSNRDAGAPPTFTTEQTLRLLQLPKAMGEVDVKGTTEMLHLYIGKYGPYLKAGKSSVNLRDVSDWENSKIYAITEERALDIFNNPPKKKSVLRELGTDSEGTEILIKTGFFGPYITDGTTNASLGKRIVEDLTLDDAIKMLVEKKSKPKRAKKGKAPAKKAAPKKKAASKKKTTAKKKATTKTAAKKTVKKKTAKKTTKSTVKKATTTKKSTASKAGKKK